MTPRHGYRKQANRNGRSEKGGRSRSGGSHGKPGRPGGRQVRASHGIRKLKATVDKNQKGFGFLIFESRAQEDVFLPPREAEKLFHGDRVAVTLNSQDEVLELKVLEHRFRELVGRYAPHPSHPEQGWAVYERRRARETVYLPSASGPAGPAGSARSIPREGDWIRVHLDFHTKGPFPVTGRILEIYGETLPARADVEMVAAEFNLIEQHSAAAEAEAAALPATPDLGELSSASGRVDLRQIPFITIDGETARDFDDAVFVERERSGYVLWVAIADVSHYVRPGSAIDKDARSRGTSVYFPERAFHMLPRALSENLCSLRPNQPRLAMVARISFDRLGVPNGTQLFEAVIESRRRATYTEIQAEWVQNRTGPKGTPGKDSRWEYAPHFALFQALRRHRLERGSIDFDLPEAEVLVEPTGEVISITQRPRNDAHRLIEEFMIAANEAVTRWAMERDWPFIFRVHEDPSPESLDRFREIAATVGVRFSAQQADSQKFMAEVIRRLEGHPAQELLNMAFLRSLKQAIYSATHGTHYGLASEAYTHFTSPIRRYPDLEVHRILRMALRAERAKGAKNAHHEKLERELEETAEHCSYRERIATDAERDAVRLKQVRAMVGRLGEEFTGRVTGFVQTGIFVQLSEPWVEGMISRDSMTDDFYEFNEERMIFYGRRKKVTFKIGDKIDVRVARVDLEKRQIEFQRLAGRQK